MALCGKSSGSDVVREWRLSSELWAVAYCLTAWHNEACAFFLCYGAVAGLPDVSYTQILLPAVCAALPSSHLSSPLPSLFPTLLPPPSLTLLYPVPPSSRPSIPAPPLLTHLFLTFPPPAPSGEQHPHAPSSLSLIPSPPPPAPSGKRHPRHLSH